MLYSDIMHPANIARLLCDVLSVALRSFSPETLVRKRVHRTPSETADPSKRRGRSRSRSRVASANASLNVSAAANGELPPPVPHRRGSSGTRSRHHRSSNANDAAASDVSRRSRHRSRSADDSDRESSRSHRHHRSSSANDAAASDVSRRSRHRSRSADDSDRESSRSHRHHRSSSANDEERRRGKDSGSVDGESVRGRDRERSERGKGSRQWWGWGSDWRSVNVTRPMYLLAHVLRAAPVSLLHFMCQVKTETAALPLLRFADLSDRARRLIPNDESGVFASDFAAGFFLTRVVLAVARQYLIERVLLENNLVVRYLRSRRVWRHTIAWTMSIFSRTPMDPVSGSVITPILLMKVADMSPVTGPLRFTSVGLSAGVALGCAGVALEMLVIPVASQLCQRAVVRIADGMEYLLFRRYSRAKKGELEVDTDGDRDRASEAGGRESETESVRESVGGEEDKEARRRARQLEKLRRRLREKADAEMSAQHLFIMRAIFYRVIAALVAQCLVQHPLSVLSHMIYSRAVLHGTGLLTAYDDFPREYPTWRGLFTLFRLDNAAADVPVVIQLLRRAGQFAGNEMAIIGQSTRERSELDAAIRELLERRGQSIGKEGEGNVASARESAELMMLSIASLAPLFTAVSFTAVDKLLSFYVAVWTRINKE